MKELKKLPIRNRRFWGRPIHVAATLTGIVLIVSSTYWIGRSDEIGEILDILHAHEGDVVLYFWDHKTGKKTAIRMIC